MNAKWHNLASEKVAEILKTNLDKGLSSSTIRKRREKWGKNKLPKEKLPSKIVVFLYQIRNPIIYFLIAAGLITAILGEKTDSLVIFVSVIINSVFGFWQENKSLSIYKKLQKVMKTKATVLRDGQKRKIFQEEIVLGDIVLIEEGDKIPADGRILESENLKISEAVITGEWLPSEKTNSVLDKDLELAERDNMAYAGSLTEVGEGKMVVIAVGKNTEIGKIASLVANAKETASPLQKKLSRFGKTISLVIISTVVLIFIGGLLRHGSSLEMFEAAVAIAVGGIPEALPVVMTVILAIGMDKLLKKKGLIRKLSSVETLGSASVICFDKTKTLTQGKMQVSQIVSKDEKLALKIAILTSEAYVENPDRPIDKWVVQGTPTGKALVIKAGEAGLIKNFLEKKSKELLRVPFDPVKKYIISLREKRGVKRLYILGAPEAILKLSNEKKNWNNQAQELMNEGLRVVAVGMKELSKEDVETFNDIEEQKGINFIGLIALRDPLRWGIEKAITTCKTAGLRPIIITGDHANTAKTIAHDAGLMIDESEICQGKDLDNLNDNQVEKLVSKIILYARAEPSHKMRIIKAWQKKGAVVAMAGDGINDAPAIKQADIGIALGSGTEVAIEAADLVLLNDSFQIIVDAIEQGRVVLDNLRKSISYVLSDSFSSLILIGFAKVIFGWPIPILPVQILWNNFVEDTIPDIAYAFEPGEKDVMKRPPNPSNSPLLTREMKVLIFGTGLVDEILTLLLFWVLWVQLRLSLDYVRTMIFGAVSIDTAFVIYAYKNLKKNIWQFNMLSNKLLLISSVLVLLSFGVAIYIPFFQKVLHTVPLGIGSWLILLGIGILSLAIVEATKWYFIKHHLD